MNGETRKEVLRALIDQLPERERFVIEGLFFERVGLGTLAKRLGCDKRTVARLRNKAYQRLGVQLTEIDGED